MTKKKVLYLLILLASLALAFEVKFTNLWDSTKEDIKEEIIEKKEDKKQGSGITKDEQDFPDVCTYVSKYKNDDIKGVLYIPGTDILEPIVQASDNDYYLNRDLYKNKDTRGSVFLDYRVKINSGRKNLIYSHNSSIHDVPFKELENYYEKDYFKEHKYIYLKDSENTYKYMIFSVYVETSDWTYTKIKFKSDEEWLKHLKYLKKNSWYDTGVEVDEKDQILILQTCSHHEKYKKYDNKYLLVIAKRIA